MARCSFCGSPHESARRLILGKSVAICADCVRACVKMLEEDDAGVIASEGEVVVRFLDGTVLACERRTVWHGFDDDAHALEWCAVYAPPPTQSDAVAVRASGGTRIVGATVGDEPVTEMAARMVVEAQGGAARLVTSGGPKALVHYKREGTVSSRVPHPESDTAFRSVTYRVPTVDLKAFEIAQDVLDCLPWKLCTDLVAIPVSRAQSSLIVAMEDPSNSEVIDKLHVCTGFKIEPVIAPRSEILAKLAYCYRHFDN